MSVLDCRRLGIHGNLKEVAYETIKQHLLALEVYGDKKNSKLDVVSLKEGKTALHKPAMRKYRIRALTNILPLQPLRNSAAQTWVPHSAIWHFCNNRLKCFDTTCKCFNESLFQPSEIGFLSSNIVKTGL